MDTYYLIQWIFYIVCWTMPIFCELLIYHTLFFVQLVEAIKKVTEIQKKRQSTYVMQRLRKGREVEQHRDIREVQRDMALIRSPAAGTVV